MFAEPGREGDRGADLLVGLAGVGARAGMGLGAAAQPVQHPPGGERLDQSPVAGVADERGKSADKEGNVVPEVLELAQFMHGDGMPQVQVRGGDVIAAVDAERPAFLFGFDESLA